MNKIKIIFLGTPEIAVSALSGILKNKEIEITCVITGEDKKIGRKQSHLQPTPVALFAEKNHLPIIKTNNVNDEYEEISKMEFDYLLTCAFGQFLSPELLKLPSKYALNIHASLLPKGRGGAPIHWAIINQEEVTGISIMEMDDKMDSGGYFIQEMIVITNDETYDSLYQKMANLINQKINYWIKEIEQGVPKIQQDKSLITYWLNIKKEDAKLDFNQKKSIISAKVRGLYSKPQSYFKLNDINYKVQEVKYFSIILKNMNEPNGKVLAIGDYQEFGTIVTNTLNEVYLTKEMLNTKGIWVKVSDGVILITKLTIPGKKPMSVSELIKGNFVIKKDLILNE